MNKKNFIDAYFYVEKNRVLSKIYNLKKGLYNLETKVYHKTLVPYIFSTKIENVESSIRIVLNNKLLNSNFNKKILIFFHKNKSIIHPLPNEHINYLKSEGINVRNLSSSFLFFFITIRSFFLGLYTNIYLLKNVLSQTNRRLSNIKFVTFCDLTENCIPFSNVNNVFNIINWYISNIDNKNIEEITHNIKSAKKIKIKNININPDIHFSKYFIINKNKIQFILWSFFAFFYFLFCILTFKFKNVLLYNEACLSKIYSLLDKNTLPVELYFSISSFWNKPLWSFVAEDRSVKVIMYSYASSFLGFKTNEGYIDQEYYYDKVRWKHIYLWSNNYYDFVKKRVPNDVKVYLVPPIYFSDSNYIVQPKKNNYIGVFDVTPMEEYYNLISIPDSSYRNYKNAIDFLNDIYDCAISNNMTILWKRKRNFGHIHNKEYIKFCNDYEKRSNVLIADPQASAFKVIQECKICISLPFTSTALIAKSLNIKSIYYDPTGFLFKDDRGAQGIKLIKSKNNLENYIKDI
jgi:polysaccharide biosynthesis PFTS motif protein